MPKKNLFMPASAFRLADRRARERNRTMIKAAAATQDKP
jgi:hypothetical protein